MRSRALELMGLAAQDWGNCYHDSFAYADFAANWRGTVPCPTEAEMAAGYALVATAQARDAVLVQIATIERSITPRRVREALRNRDSGWLAARDDEIAALRAQL